MAEKEWKDRAKSSRGGAQWYEYWKFYQLVLTNFCHLFLLSHRAREQNTRTCSECHQIQKSQLGEEHVDTVEAACIVAAIERKINTGRR